MTLLGSGLGSGTVYLTFIIGRRIRGPLVGLLACLYVAVYPYYVWHDAVLQETATLTFVVACALLMLIRSNSDTSRWTHLGAGCALGLTVLTKANLLLYVPLAIGWAFLAAPGGWPRRIRPALWLTFGVVLTLSPWMIRTWHIAGAPMIYSKGGFSLWTSNHRLTFDYFPRLSIDAASEPEWNDMTAAERNEYDAIRDPQGIDQTLWLWHKGMTYIRSHPGQTFLRSLYKVWIAFSPVFSPAKGGAFQMAYAIFYLPLFAFSGIGLWLTRRRWRDTGYFLLLVLSFALCSAVFWGHTSHRMYLEPYLMVLSACVVQEFCLPANAKRSAPEGFEPFWQKAGLDY
jgi:4-amino-4-deoxy-L-arabinose transferase-like glycosyltransferase